MKLLFHASAKVDRQDLDYIFPPQYLSGNIERGVYAAALYRRLLPAHPGAQVQSARVYERYKQWAADNNLRKLSGTAFGPEMKRTYRQHRNSQGTYYVGISLKP